MGDPRRDGRAHPERRPHLPGGARAEDREDPGHRQPTLPRSGDPRRGRRRAAPGLLRRPRRRSPRRHHRALAQAPGLHRAPRDHPIHRARARRAAPARGGRRGEAEHARAAHLHGRSGGRRDPARAAALGAQGGGEARQAAGDRVRPEGRRRDPAAARIDEGGAVPATPGLARHLRPADPADQRRRRAPDLRHRPGRAARPADHRARLQRPADPRGGRRHRPPAADHARLPRSSPRQAADAARRARLARRLRDVYPRAPARGPRAAEDRRGSGPQARHRQRPQDRRVPRLRLHLRRRDPRARPLPRGERAAGRLRPGLPRHLAPRLLHGGRDGDRPRRRRSSTTPTAASSTRP